MDFSILDYLLPHPIWSEDEVQTVRVKHKEPKGFVDKLAYYTVQVMRKTFDFVSGYTINTKLETLDERSCLIRCIFLETVAGEILGYLQGRGMICHPLYKQ